MKYANNGLVRMREETIDGVGPWVWATKDIVAWEAPKHDWEKSHRDFITKLVPESERNVVVQAGGNMGMYPRLLSDMFKAVYTFEPDSLNFHCLVANCQRENIIKINAALGFDHQLVTVQNSWADWEQNYGVRSVTPMNTSIIPTFSIDDLGLTECNLIMLDVEGYELNVLKGAINTLEKFRPVVFAEYGDSCIPYMESFGYIELCKSMNDTIFVDKHKKYDVQLT